MTETELAYAAGVIDGEGCLYLRQGARGNLLPRLQVVNTNPVLPDWLVSRFGGTLYRAERPKRPEHKTLIHWHLGGAAAVDVLRRVRPYLVLKHAQAALMIEAWDNRQATPIKDRRKPVNPDVLAQRAEWVKQMHDLNKKGA